MTDSMPGTPELNRMMKAKEDYGTEYIGEFLEAMEFPNAGKYVLCELVPCTVEFHNSERYYNCCESETHMVPATKSIDQILAEYVGIDLAKVEQERANLIAWLRNNNNNNNN